MLGKSASRHLESLKVSIKNCSLPVRKVKTDKQKMTGRTISDCRYYHKAVFPSIIQTKYSTPGQIKQFLPLTFKTYRNENCPL